MVMLLFACAGPGNPTKPADSETVDTADSETETATHTSETGDSSPDTDTATDSDTNTVPVDADGDGFLSDVDCDDADVYTHLGAVDWCDAADQDCDGDPVGAGMCGRYNRVTETAADEWWGPPTFTAVATMTWPTSEGELLGGPSNCADEDGVIRGWQCIAFTGSRGEGERDATEFYVWQRDRTYSLGPLSAVGDFNGDGWPDVASGGGDTDGTSVGAVWLLSGNAADWGASDATLPVTALAWWQQDAGGDDFGQFVSGEADVDADGLSDMLVQAPYEYDGGLNGRLYLIRGRTTYFPRGEEAGTEIWFDYTTDEEDDEYNSIDLVHDLDGDGADDALASIIVDPGQQYSVVSGPSLAEMAGAPITDVFPLTAVDETIRWLPLDDGRRIGDVDGDGIGDVGAWARWEDDADTDCFSVLSGSALAAAAPAAEVVLTELCREDGWSLTDDSNFRMSHDIDGDGLLDGLFRVGYSPDDRDPLCILPTTRLPLGGRVYLEALGPCFTADRDEWLQGYHNLADLDDDGIPEFHFFYEDRRGAGLDSMFSLGGFEIPWDDPSKW